MIPTARLVTDDLLTPWALDPSAEGPKLFSEHLPGSLDIKGPSLHHELKVLRVWNCPACGRSVRAGGEVTARLCDCNDQPRMQYSDAEPLIPADVSAFVTYMTPEFQEEDDDGTDLALPDIDSLVMPALEPRGRRNRPGRPLRDTIAEVTPETEDHLFGDGLDVIESHPADATSEAGPATIEGSELSDAQTDERASAKPKSRRRRRRGSRSERSVRSGTDADQGDAASLPEGRQSSVRSTDAEHPTQSQPSMADSSTVASTDEAAETGEQNDGGTGHQKRRRRRRRGPRKKSNPGSDPSPGSGSSPAGGTDT